MRFFLVCPVGFEPTTYGLEVRRSIQLSYGHAYFKDENFSIRQLVLIFKFRFTLLEQQIMYQILLLLL